MGKSRFLTGKVIVAIASLPAIIAVGVALGIGNAWAFGDGSSTMTTYLTTPVPVDKSAMTRSVSGMGDELAVEVEAPRGIIVLVAAVHFRPDEGAQELVALEVGVVGRQRLGLREQAPVVEIVEAGTHPDVDVAGLAGREGRSHGVVHDAHVAYHSLVEDVEV